MISTANAPVSYGVFELGAGRGAKLPDGEQLAAAVHEAGYDGVDLGPVGFLGRGAALRDRLRRHALSLVGGWIDLPFCDDAEFAAARTGLREALQVFAEAAEVDPARPPRPTLACSGSAERKASPGGGPGLGLTGAQWDGYAANVQAAVDEVRAAGFEPTFHHHACTYVETPEEIDELLARTDVGLCLDSGHLLLGGGDPVRALDRWGGRINHVHVKDFRRSVIDAVVKGAGDLRMAWAGRAFVPLGTGDLDLVGFMDALVASGYDGWLVVEQDTIPGPDDPPELAQADQVANREALRRWLP